MIDLRPNCVLQLKMNDDAASPYIVPTGVSVPVELVPNGLFEDDSLWNWGDFWHHDPDDKNAYCLALGVSTGWLNQADIGIQNGAKYLLAYNVADVLEANVGVSGYIDDTAGEYHKTVEDVLEILTASSDDTGIWFRANDAKLAIDNIFAFNLDAHPLTGVFRSREYGGNPCTSAHSVAGKVGKAIRFVAENEERIIVPDEGALEFGSDTQDFSIAILFRRTGTGVEYLLHKSDGINDGWLLFFLPANKLRFILNGKGLTGATAITDTDWHLAIIVVNRTGNAQLYLDNVADGNPVDVSGETMSITAPLCVGATNTGTSWFDGDICLIDFINKAFSEAECGFLWNNGNCTERLTRVARPLVNASLASGKKGLVCI